MKYLRSDRNGWAVLLSLFALYLQIFLPLGQAVAASRPADDGISSRIIICTLYGPKLIYDAMGKEVPPEDGGMVDCPVCLALAIGASALAHSGEPVLPVPPTTIEKSIDIAYAVLDGLSTSASYLTRAPPAAV
jgi:hypothetical protein